MTRIKATGHATTLPASCTLHTQTQPRAPTRSRAPCLSQGTQRCCAPTHSRAPGLSQCTEIPCSPTHGCAPCEGGGQQPGGPRQRPIVAVLAVTDDEQRGQGEHELKRHVQVAPAIQCEDADELQGKDVEAAPCAHVPARMDPGGYMGH
eukprot:scaffold112104_cov24-Tisochrysis_lutea.AAC.4